MDATPPEGPQQENFIIKNQDIAKRIDALLGHPSIDPQHASACIDFKGPSEIIRCSAAIEEAEKYEEMKTLDTQHLVPDRLDFPVFALYVSKKESTTMQITQYGFLPEYAVSDNRLFQVFNKYYFSLSGKAIKVTEIKEEPGLGWSVEDIWVNDIGGKREYLPFLTTELHLQDETIITDLATEPPTERSNDYRLIDQLLNKIPGMQKGLSQRFDD